MARYLARQVVKGNLEYDWVINKYPDLKEDIDYWIEVLS
jgi:hypothetical protein